MFYEVFNKPIYFISVVKLEATTKNFKYLSAKNHANTDLSYVSDFKKICVVCFILMS